LCHVREICTYKIHSIPINKVNDMNKDVLRQFKASFLKKPLNCVFLLDFNSFQEKKEKENSLLSLNCMLQHSHHWD
jgi:hypothetical protein